MFTNVAYLHNSLNDMVDTSKSLIVTSCGYYRVHSRPVVSTERPTGRRDYQLLYIAKGKGHFYFDGKEQIITEGNMILYRPNEVQMYYYYAPDKTEAYWVHFTGRHVESILEFYELPETENVFYTGTSPDYQWMYRQMIQELQLCRANYEELLSLMLRHIFIMINRYIVEGRKAGSDIQNEIERATHYFNENYNKPLNIDEYAESRHMSTCWFIRSFKQILKVTPMQYILSLRMANAQSLLETSEYNISEIAEAVGYDNPLYFSRLFHKHIGVSPTEYRKMRSGKL
ncbi:MAG: helix-turn-helix domain-containing protein [Oscillospiraceae bacterium]|nr:helix-turn-helix domain-containing protein [Oscillospiraceae bacterium]